jgi:hypothetical protein
LAGRSLILVLLACLAGCRSQPEKAPARAAGPDLDAELARARAERRPVLVLVTEEGKSPEDAAARALLGDPEVRARAEKTWIVVDLDLDASRSRAAATRFHAATTPLAICISSGGVIVSRDEKVTREIVLSHMDAAERTGPEIDRTLASLEEATAGKCVSSVVAGEWTRSVYAVGTDADRMKLADFLVEHGNAHEAIPHLETVRRSGEADLALRDRAAVLEVRAHYWVGEPEKGRHVAEELIATLGATSADARAAGYFVLGAQDVQGRHKELGLRELDQAIAAAPDSVYGKQASELRAKVAK